MRIIAHRAISGGASENLVSSISSAGESGAHAVELDVRVTRDGVAVLSHDAIPWRTTRRPIPVAWLSARSFARLRDRTTGEPLPTLAVAIKAAREANLGVVLDLKAGNALEASGRALDLAALGDDLDLWVRSADLLGPARELAPRATLGLLRDTDDLQSTLRYVDDSAAAGADLVSVHAERACIETRDHARRLGLQYVVWVEKLNQQAGAAALTPNGIVTDWPELRTGS